MPFREDSPSGCVFESNSSYEVHEDRLIPFDYVRSAHKRDSVERRGSNVRKSGGRIEWPSLAKVSHEVRLQGEDEEAVTYASMNELGM